MAKNMANRSSILGSWLIPREGWPRQDAVPSPAPSLATPRWSLHWTIIDPMACDSAMLRCCGWWRDLMRGLGASILMISYDILWFGARLCINVYHVHLFSWCCWCMLLCIFTHIQTHSGTSGRQVSDFCPSCSCHARVVVSRIVIDIFSWILWMLLMLFHSWTYFDHDPT